jgi:hypothetical protein
MLLSAALMYHLAYRSGAIAVSVNYQTTTDRYGFARISAGRATIHNGEQRFTVDLARLMPITLHHILLPTGVRDGCGALQPLAVVSHYVVMEAVWAEKGCRPAAYFIDTSAGAIAETVDLDHRWNHRVDVQPARFDGKPVVVESVDHVTLALATFDSLGRGMNGSVPWVFAIVRGRDTRGEQRLFAYEVATVHVDQQPDPGWNVFPSPGSTTEVGSLTGLFTTSYHPDPHVLRMDAADDSRYAQRQPLTPEPEIRNLEYNQWFELMDDYVAADRFSDALGALAKTISFSDDPSLRAGEQEMYSACRAMVAQVQAGKISAASARTAWSKGCRIKAER